MSVNVAVIRSVYDAFASNNASAVMDAMAEDIVWNEAESFPYADGNPYRGPGAVAQGVFMRIATDITDFTVTPETFLDAGDVVVALGRYRGTGAETGRAMDAQFAHVWWLDGGKIVRFQQYTDTLQASHVLGRI